VTAHVLQYVLAYLLVAWCALALTGALAWSAGTSAWRFLLRRTRAADRRRKRMAVREPGRMLADCDDHGMWRESRTRPRPAYPYRLRRNGRLRGRDIQTLQARADWAAWAQQLAHEPPDG